MRRKSCDGEGVLMIKIVIADDEPVERRQLEKLLSEEGIGLPIEVRTAENGRLAVINATLWKADLVLMDIEMPGMNGIDAASEIISQLPSCRIIFITAYSVFDYAQQAVRLGASDYILKPFESENVISAIRKASLQIESQRQLEDMKEVAGDIEEGKDSDKSSQLISRVCKYISNNYTSYDLSLDSVSDILGITPSYLSSLFKKCTGVNFIDYISNIRIQTAKELLKDPLRSAGEIAELSGYESASYFTRAFKKKTGLTPTEYRRQNPSEGAGEVE